MITIIIPTYQHFDDLLKPCLDSIVKYTDLSKVYIIVVANGCTDGTAEYVRSLGKPFHLVEMKEQAGYTKAVNEGMKYIPDGTYGTILLNNDTILLDQPKHAWVNILVNKMEEDLKNGIVAVTVKTSEATGRKFGIFFCVLIKGQTLLEVGPLDEVFAPGYGEDIDFCHKAEDRGWKVVAAIGGEDTQKYETAFPIYHIGSVSVVADIADYDDVVERNDGILRHRYVITPLETQFERFVAGTKDDIPPRERARYEYARKQLKGKKILDIGCSSGYGVRFFKDVKDLDYTGLDYNKNIIEFARANYGDIPGVKFIHGSLLDFDYEDYDLIIAFEILEHVDEGRVVAQRLKQYGKKVVISCPFNEPTMQEIEQGSPGVNWGIHHKLHRLQHTDFPGFDYLYMDPEGNLLPGPDPNNGFHLLLMTYPTKRPPTVTATISTKNRYFSTLPGCLLSIATQTVKPDRVVIYDDGDQIDLRQVPIYGNIFAMFDRLGIDWQVKFGSRKGQVTNHIDAIMNEKADYIWRIDDDNFVEANVLENLIILLEKPHVGAAAGTSIQPNLTIHSAEASSSIEDLFSKPNKQWTQFNYVTDVDHLHNTFIFKRILGRNLHNTNLSVVGHREETLFSYRLQQLGFDLLVNGNLTTWHLREPTGGIRSFDDVQNYEHDELIFQEEMQKLNPEILNQPFLAVLDCGIGDHFAFKHILPQLMEKHAAVNLAVCYPQVFEDSILKFDKLRLISIGEASKLDSNLSRFNIYKWMQDNNWKDNLVEAYRSMYEV